MKSLSTILLLAAIVVADNSSFAEARMSNPCSNLERMSDQTSLTEMVQKSSFIGVYMATSVERLQSSIFDEPDFDSYRYSFFRSIKYSGEAPHDLDLIGWKDYEEIPPHYFGMLRRHETVDHEAVGKTGTSFAMKLKDSKECRYAPRFKIGYNYLIFGDVENSMNYEVILDQEFDEWDKMVREETKGLRN